MKRRKAGDAIADAIAVHRAGRLDDARTRYQRILAADANHVAALHYLGVLEHQAGDSGRGIASIERALQLAPDYADAHNNLGNILKETRQLEAAFSAYRRVVEITPDHADAWNNIGVLLRGQRRYEEADRAYARALQANPAHVAAWQNRARLFARLSRLDDAVAAYERVLELRPGYTGAYDALGRTLYRAGRIDQALALYQRWLEMDPGNSVARHMLAACSGTAAPPRASDAYVRDTFDAFAGSFDEVLDQLGYRAPALIGGLLDRELAERDGSLAVADLGCGTGLCAEFLRPRAKWLAGIDLSAGMLARARARGGYDELIQSELTAWLGGVPGGCDLIVSADTLCYFGALEAVLAAAYGAMRPGALLVFTVEDAGDSADPHRLNASGRYSHRSSYARDALAAAGFDAIAIEEGVLRREVGVNVRGLLVSARRPQVKEGT